MAINTESLIANSCGNMSLSLSKYCENGNGENNKKFVHFVNIVFHVTLPWSFHASFVLIRSITNFKRPKRVLHVFQSAGWGGHYSQY